MNTKKSFLEKIGNMPVPLLPTMVGAATLSNVYLTMGYSWVRHLTMWAATIILIAYILKISFFFNTVKNEYSNTVPASLYAGFTMVTMILGSYYFTYFPMFGKALWFTGLTLHAIHICVFTYNNVFKGINKDTFLPSWFVTYNGIMVSTVVGGVMNEPFIGKIVVYYGIAIFATIIPFMIVRLRKHPIKDAFFHTQAILLAPSSLCVVSYINFIPNPNPIVLYVLYAIVFITLIFVVSKLRAFFSYAFTPGFAGLTFPMAIGIVATMKMATFLKSIGYEAFGNILNEISGIQIYLTTAIIGMVLFNFFKMFINSFNTGE